MKRLTYIVLEIGVVLSLLATAARGQASTEAWGFVSARYDGRSSASISSGYGWRRLFVWGGLVRDAGSGDAELLGGFGAVFETGASAEHWVAFAATRSNDVPLAQLYWLPTVRTGAVTTRAQVNWSVAYGGRAPQKVSIAPLSMTVQLAYGLAGGPAMDLTAAEGAHPRFAPGFELRLKLPGGSVGIDALRDVNRGGTRIRLFFGALYE